MVKEPRPGRVKTRLGADIGMTAAAWWFRHQSLGLLRRIQDARWQTSIAVSPDNAGLQSRVWPSHLRRWPQGDGNLGDRMRRIFEQFPVGPLLIIGSDIPGITRRHIADGFAALKTNDIVFGPAPDGGFWCVGMRRNCPVSDGLFQSVRWSTEHALADCVAGLPGLRIGMIDTLRDVDTLDDL